MRRARFSVAFSLLARYQRRGVKEVASIARAVAGHRYWLQIDVDVLDPSVMPAVDSPAPGGLSPDELVEFLQTVRPDAQGASVTVYNPDLDPDGTYARLLVDVVVDGLAGLGSHR